MLRFICFAECHYAQCRYANAMYDVVLLNVIMYSVVMQNVIILSVAMLSVVMLNVVMLNVVMLNVIILSVIMLNVIILSAVMLSIVAPLSKPTHFALSLKRLVVTNALAYYIPSVSLLQRHQETTRDHLTRPEPTQGCKWKSRASPPGAYFINVLRP